LRDHTVFDLVRIAELALEIPGLRFPFDLTGGATRFQRRRCALRRATLALTERRLDAWLRSRPRLRGLGIEELALRLAHGQLRVSGWQRVGQWTVELTAKIALRPADAGRAALSLWELRAYGGPAMSGPALGLAL